MSPNTQDLFVKTNTLSVSVSVALAVEIDIFLVDVVVTC